MSKMADPKINPVRINFRTAEKIEKFRKFETILVVQGIDEIEFLDDFLDIFLGENEAVLGNRRIVDGTALTDEVNRLYPDSKLDHRDKLRAIRKAFWVEGEHYFVAPNGNTQVYRYDLGKCLKHWSEGE